MEFLPLEVQEHIGVYLPPNDYKQFWMSFRTFLPIKQRITLGTLMSCGQLEDSTLELNGKCFSGLQLVGMDQWSSDDWFKFENVVAEHGCIEGIHELYCNAIRMILKDIPVCFTQESTVWALEYFSEIGEVDFIQPLLNHLSLIPNGLSLILACQQGNSEIVEILLKDGRIFTQSALNRTISEIPYGISSNHVEIVKLLLQDPRTNPYHDDYDPLVDAINRSSVPIIKLLLNQECIDPSVDDNEAIWLACYQFNAKADIVRLLLQDPRVDPSARENGCIRMASERGHIELVQLLLQDPRVDPTAHENYCIRIASRRGDIELVQLLLQDPRVNPSAKNNESLGYAVVNSNVELAKTLIDDGRLDPEEILDVVLKAVGTGSLEILKFLLDHPKLNLDLGQFKEDLIAVAAANNNVDILEYLLEDGRLIPQEKALCEASFLGFLEVVEMLLSDSRLNIRQTKAQYYLNRAKENQSSKKGYCSTCKCLHPDEES